MLALSLIAALSLLFGLAWLVKLSLLDDRTVEEKQADALPRVLTLPFGQSPAPIYHPKRKKPDPPADREESIEAAPPPPDPIPLSKLRAERLARSSSLTPPGRHRMRSVLSRAELPRSGPACEVCKGVILVWTTDPNGGWRALCRRCGLPIFQQVSGSGWQKPDPRPFPAA